MIFTEYNSTTGEIGGLHSGYSNAEEAKVQIFLKGMDAVMEGEYDSRTYYIKNGQPTERPPSPVTLDGLILMGVPEGSTLWCDGQGYSAEGDVTLEFPLPGNYQLRVECWPYQDWTAEVMV